MQVNDLGYLIIDIENLLWRHFHAQKDLRTSTGIASGAFFGVLKSIKSLQEKYGFKRVYITWGDKRHNLKRTKVNDEYKGTRDVGKYELIRETVTDLKTFFSRLNVPQMFAEGYEADDVIAYLAQSFSVRYQKSTILTGDKDLIQLIDKNTDMLRPVKKELKLINLSNFKETFNIPTPRHIVPYLALLGDKSDNVKGVTGIGEKAALHLVNTCVGDAKHFKSWLVTSDFPDIKQSIFTKILLGYKDYLQSLDMIDLLNSPISIFQDNVYIENISKELEFNEVAAARILDKYEVKSVKVVDIPHPQPKLQDVESFTGAHSFLSNFYPVLIRHKDIVYPTVEHFFQAQKTNDLKQRRMIASLDTPAKAKHNGKVLDLRANWEEIKLKVMKWGLVQKFADSELKHMLLATGDKQLIEGNNWKDTFWGVDKALGGKNHLGKLLMEIRNDFRRPQPIKECNKCEELAGNRSNIVNSNFKQPVDILFVAEAPGATEDIEGIEPLTGEAGELLNSMLEKAGINRADVSVANICRCRPPKNRTPSAKEGKACLPYLLKEIEHYKPGLIITLGKTALQFLSNSVHTSVQKVRGNILTINGWTVMPTWHPAYILRSPAEETSTVNDFKKAANYLAGRETVVAVDYKVLKTVDELKDYVDNHLKKVPIFTFDYETSSLHPETGEILCLSLSAKSHEARVFPFRGQWLEEIHTPEELERAKSILGELFEGYPHIAKVAHNAEFDYRWTTEKGVAKDISNLHCSMLMHYVTDENTLHDLKSLTARFTDIEMYDDEVKKLAKRDSHDTVVKDLGEDSYAYVPNDILWKYAGTDTDSTIRIYPIFLEEIKKQNLTNFTFKFFLPLLKFFAEVKKHGIRVDMKYLERMIEVYTERVNKALSSLYQVVHVKKAEKLVYEAAAEKIRIRYNNLKTRRLTESEYIQKYTKEEPFNFNSPKQLQILMFDVLKLRVLSRTAKGAPQLNADNLEVYEEQGHPFVKDLLAYKRASKFLSTFLIGIRNKMIDGRIHVDLLLHGTVTGRLCVAGDTLLATNRGSFAISDLSLEKDKAVTIMSHRGEQKRVLNKFYKGEEQMYKVSTSNSNNITCTKGHKFLTPKGWQALGELEIGSEIYSHDYQATNSRLYAATGCAGREQFRETVFRGRINSEENDREVPHRPFSLLEISKALENKVWLAVKKRTAQKSLQSVKRQHSRKERASGYFRKRRTAGAERRGQQFSGTFEALRSQRVHYSKKFRLSQYFIKSNVTSSHTRNRRGLFDTFRSTLPRTDIFCYIRKLLRGSASLLREFVSSVPTVTSNALVYQGSGDRAHFSQGYRCNTEKSYLLEFESLRDSIITSFTRFKDSTYSAIQPFQEFYGRFLFSRKAPNSGAGWGVSRNNIQGVRQDQGGIHEGKQLQVTPDSSGQILGEARRSHLRNTAVITKIEPVGVQGVWDIEVEDDHSYCAHGFINHNSSRNPNMQNIPKKADPEKAREIRNIFIADEDYVLIEADYKQAEFRLFADYSKDERMLADLEKLDFDIHTNIAAKGFNVPVAEVTEKQRTAAKQVVFGFMYGRGLPSVAKQLGITIDAAQRLANIIFNTYPKAKEWLADTTKFAKKYKYVENLFGRRRHLKGIIDSLNEEERASGERYAVNSPIQGGASDLTSLSAKLVQRQFDKFGLRAKVLILIHDAVICQIHKDDVDQAIEVLKRVMVKPTKRVSVRLDVDVDISPIDEHGVSRMGEMISYEEYEPAA